MSELLDLEPETLQLVHGSSPTMITNASLFSPVNLTENLPRLRVFGAKKEGQATAMVTEEESTLQSEICEIENLLVDWDEFVKVFLSSKGYYDRRSEMWSQLHEQCKTIFVRDLLTSSPRNLEQEDDTYDMILNSLHEHYLADLMEEARNSFVELKQKIQWKHGFSIVTTPKTCFFGRSINITGP